MTKTLFKVGDIAIEEAPPDGGALVQCDSEVLIQTPSEMSNELPSDDMTVIPVEVYSRNYDRWWHSALDYSVKIGCGILENIRNDGTLYRIVSDTDLCRIGNSIGAASAATSQMLAQGMLIQISLQLAELCAMMQAVHDESFKVACNELKGKIEAIETGILLFKSKGNRDLLAPPLCEFHSAFDVLYGKTKDRISEVQTKPRIYENWHLWGKGFRGRIEKDCALIGYALRMLFKSITIAAKGFSIYDPNMGIAEAKRRFQAMQELEYVRLTDAIRILPYDDNWKVFENDVLETGKLLPHVCAGFGKRPVIVLPGRDIHAIAGNA